MSAMICAATGEDAQPIGKLAQEFQGYLRGLGDLTQCVFTAETYLRDGFGYDTDWAMRLMYVIDLYVREAQRRGGVGEALMRVAAEMCRGTGGREMIWSVFKPNTLACQFYERLGAKHIQELAFMYWPVPAS